MKPLKYGRNKVPDSSSTIDIMRSPTSPTGRMIKLNIPRAKPISEVLQPVQQNQMYPPAPLQETDNMLKANKGFDPASVVRTQDNDYIADEDFNRIEDSIKNMLGTQRILDSIVEEAAMRNPRIKEDLMNHRMDHFEEFRQMYPEHETLQQQKSALLQEIMNDPKLKQHQKKAQGILKEKNPEFQADENTIYFSPESHEF
jgi:hypothetical protein